MTLRKLHFNLKACPHIPHLSSSVQLCAIVQQRLCWVSFRRRMHSRRPAVIIPHMLLQHTQVGDRFLLLVGKTVTVATGQTDASHHKTIYSIVVDFCGSLLLKMLQLQFTAETNLFVLLWTSTNNLLKLFIFISTSF